LKFSLTETLNSIKNLWKKLTRPQKVALVAIPLIVAIALLSLVLWASRPQYVPLFTKQGASEAGAITEKLKELKIDYRLADGGTTIEVPQKDLAEARIQLANAGLPAKSTFSFEYLDQLRIGETDADRKLRYILGLQNELEQTIGTLEGVEYARVHIVMPEESLFAGSQKDTTAAVTIKRKNGEEMSESQIRAIANLIAYSVEGLTTDKVSIVDTNGNILSDKIGNSSQMLTSDQLKYQQMVEDNLRKSVQTMLDKVFGAGATIVRTNATLDFDQKRITSQISEEGPVTSRQQTSERSSSTSETGGVPGTTANVPGYPVTGGNNTNSTSEKNSLSEQFQPSITQQETVVSPGQIKRLTVSVLADADTITEEQLASINSIVSSAVGIDQNRGDLVQVARLPFNKTTQMEEEAAREAAAKKAQLVLYGQIGAAVLIALILLIVLLRLRKKKHLAALEVPEGQRLVTLEEAEQILAAQMEAERAADLKLARMKVKSQEVIAKEKIRQEVDRFTRENPDDVARLVKAWLAEE